MYEDDGHFGRIGHLPSDTRLAELRSPDQCPSYSIFEIGNVGPHLVQVMDARSESGVRLGAIVIRVVGDEATGRLGIHGVSTFTREEIEHAC